MIRKIVAILLYLLLTPPALAAPVESSCPQDVQTLTSLLLKDLPHYTNRLRSRLGVEPPTYMLVAGKAEFEPLPLSQNQYRRVFEQEPTQVFFTTLERTYRGKQVIEVQNYHWLMLVETSAGWQLFTLFSSLGSSQADFPPDPPLESNQSAVAQGIRLWLRDCQSR